MKDALQALLVATAFGLLSTVVAGVASLLQSARLIARLALHSDPEGCVRLLIHSAEQSPVAGDLRIQLQFHNIQSESIAVKSFVGPEFDGQLRASQEPEGVVLNINARHKPKPGRSWMWEVRPSGAEKGRCQSVTCVVSGRRVRRQQLLVNSKRTSEPSVTTKDTIHRVLFQGIAFVLGTTVGVGIISIMGALDVVNVASLVALNVMTFVFLRGRLMPIKPFVAVGYIQGHTSIVEPNAAPRAIHLFANAAAVTPRVG